MSTNKPTLSEQVAALTQLVTTLTGVVTGQHATPSAVVEVVTPTVKAEPKPEPVKSASDELKDFVESAGLAFARGGRTALSTEALEACVRVLRTGSPEILPVSERLQKRNVVGLAIGRDGKTVITQYLFQPEK